MMDSIAVLVVAAGSSRRMGFDKLEADLDGLSVLEQTLQAFQQCPEVDSITVATNAEKIARLQSRAEELELSKFAGAVVGGAERHLSVLAGLEHLQAIGASWVAVHDGARPLISPNAVQRCFDSVRRHDAACLAHRVADTLKRGDADLRVTGSVSREHLWAMETPQMFRLSLLLECYHRALAIPGFIPTDETSVVEAAGHPVHLVENLTPNFKITVPSDLLVAQAVLKARRQEQAI